jgi:hypothetical protein
MIPILYIHGLKLGSFNPGTSKFISEWGKNWLLWHFTKMNICKSIRKNSEIFRSDIISTEKIHIITESEFIGAVLVFVNLVE